VWARPDNLTRSWPPDLVPRVLLIRGRPEWSDPAPGELVAALWDLGAWSGRATALAGALESDVDPATRFVVAAAVLRHLGEDPLLPPSLLPVGWPGARLRAAYATYARGFAAFLRQELVRHVPDPPGPDDG
jgi:phenylacetic acid degradation operon negative regulatory protein